jgi:hypothetical protein
LSKLSGKRWIEVTVFTSFVDFLPLFSPLLIFSASVPNSASPWVKIFAAPIVNWLNQYSRPDFKLPINLNFSLKKEEMEEISKHPRPMKLLSEKVIGKFSEGLTEQGAKGTNQKVLFSFLTCSSLT